VWTLIQHLWSPDPRYRPSASDTVSLLNHAARRLPPAVINRIVIFSVTLHSDIWNRDSAWKKQTRSLLALSLVSRSFCAHATPLLYRDIRILSSNPESKLSSLANTLNINIKCRHTSDDLSSGYGYYTRTFLLHIRPGAHTLPPYIQGLLVKMPNLHTLLFRTISTFNWGLEIHSLRSVVFQRVSPSLIWDQGTLRVLLRFQRLYVDPEDHSGLPLPVISQARQVPLLPNLQDITTQGYFRESRGPLQLFDAFKGWTTPRLNFLRHALGDPDLPDSSFASFVRFLQVQGSLLRDFTLDTPTSAPISDILPLCSNLQSLRISFFRSFDLLSVPPHLKLEMLDVHQRLWRRGEHAQPHLDQFEKFTASWKTRFPNLRVAKLMGCEGVPNDIDLLGMHFCTEDRFYTVKMKRRYASPGKILNSTEVR
jgi:hypothetical protein